MGIADLAADITRRIEQPVYEPMKRAQKVRKDKGAKRVRVS